MFNTHFRSYIASCYRGVKSDNIPAPIDGCLFALVTGARQSTGCGVLVIHARDLYRLPESLFMETSEGITEWRGDAPFRKIAPMLKERDIDFLHFNTVIVKPKSVDFERLAIDVIMEHFHRYGMRVVYDGAHKALHRDGYAFSSNGKLLYGIEAKGRCGRFASNLTREKLGLTDFYYGVSEMCLNEIHYILDGE